MSAVKWKLLTLMPSNLFDLMEGYVQSVHVHDNWASNVMPEVQFGSL
jgi:hypothetical protein